MAQNGSIDQANNSPFWGPELINKKANTANRTALFGNTTANAFVSGQTVGVFAVDATEIKLDGGKAAHTGWNLRKVGTGGRAGRVMTECLIAGGISGDADTVYSTVVITINTQPTSKTVAGNTATTFTVAATSVPNTAMTYVWKGNSGAGYVTLTNSGVYSNTTTPVLSISNTAGLDGVVYQAVVSATDAANAYSAPATLTVT